MINKKKNFIPICLTLLVMTAIFLFSSRDVDDSVGQSTVITRFICRIIFFRYEKMSWAQQNFLVTELDFFIRKLAHFTIYLFLGICTYTTVLGSDTEKLKIKDKWCFAAVVCMVYAIFDEIHQHFTPGRTMRASDVCIDTMGALLGIIIVRAAIIIFSYSAEYFKKLRKRWKNDIKVM